MILKKCSAWLSLSLAVLFSASAWANHKEWDATWLFGVDVGWENRSGATNFEVVHPSAFTTPLFPTAANTMELTSVAKTGLSDDGVIAGGFFGRQWECNKWVFGAEVGAEWMDLSDDHAFNYVTRIGDAGVAYARFERDWGVTVTGKGGYRFYQYFMPYWRLGVQISEDKLYTRHQDLTPTPTLLGPEDSHKRTVASFLGGLGFEIPCWMGSALRFEWNYIRGWRLRTVDVDTPAGSPSETTYTNFDFKPDSHVFKAAWVFFFN